MSELRNTPAKNPPPRRARGKAPDARDGGASRPEPSGRGSAAASDDASGLTGKEAPISIRATPPARQACAAAAQPREEGSTPRVPGDAAHRAVPGDAECAPFDETQALQDGASFVRAVSAHKSLVGLAVALLSSKDERIKQRTWERLVNIGPGKGTAVEDEVIWDIPHPERE